MAALTREDLLTAYAAGTTSPGLSLMCAAHASLSRDAQDFLDSLDEIGGAMLCAEETDAVAPMSFEALLGRLDEDEDKRIVSCGRESLPGPVMRAVGVRFDEIPWRFRLPGIHEHRLTGFEQETVSIMRARPGSKILKHTHEGDEATLILAGCMRDGGVDFRKGDIALAGPEDDHTPEIIGEETCYCLIVRDGALRFTGRFGRALNLFAE